MNDYREVMAKAEEQAARGEYKEAYNTLGVALTVGSAEDQQVRYLRGVYAYYVGHSRLNSVEQSRQVGKTLFKAACWLSRSEAMLRSAAEMAPEHEQGRIEDDLTRTKHEQDRFRRLWRESAAVKASAP